MGCGWCGAGHPIYQRVLLHGRATLAGLLKPARGGLMPVPQGPGLGVEVSDELLSEARVQEIS